MISSFDQLAHSNAPWPHAICDNFLHAEHVTELREYAKQLNVAEDHKSFYSHKILASGDITQCDLFDPVFLMEIGNSYKEFFDRYLKKFRPIKSSLANYYDISLQVSGPRFEDNIHCDVPRKLVSGVVYLSSGDSGVGTLLYDRTANQKSELVVPWQDNRALFFCRDEQTFHSYRGNGKDHRVTLIYNLCTNHHSIAKNIDRFRKVWCGLRSS